MEIIGKPNLKGIPAPVFIIILLITGGCSVGTKVNLTAHSVQYPISMTYSFYSDSNALILPRQYELLEEFSIEFTKWGISAPLNLNANADLSTILNEIIENQQGDAIIDLSISVFNPPGRNGMLLLTKTLALTSALIFITLTITDPKASYAVLAAGSAALFLFTPAAADIRIEGRVVRIIDN